MEYTKYPDMVQFEKGLSELEITLSDIQKQQFVDYYELLVEWNKVMNLTAITDFSEVVVKHFIDSLSIVKTVKLEKEKILDLGTGAGFPGLPIKIAFPETDILLLDSLNKRIKFLDEVIIRLNLKKIKTLHGRAEDVAREEGCREAFDITTSRAVAKLSTLSEYCLPYVKKGGFFIPYKSGEIEEELSQAERALHLLGAEVESVKRFKLPASDIERTLILIRKTKATPKIYPRGAGKPTKEPL